MIEDQHLRVFDGMHLGTVQRVACTEQLILNWYKGLLDLPCLSETNRQTEQRICKIFESPKKGKLFRSQSISSGMAENSEKSDCMKRIEH